MMTHPSATAVHVRRTIPAAPERVYRAWLDPQLMADWFAPAGLTGRKAEEVECVFGRLRLTFTPIPDGTQLDLTHDRLDGLRDRWSDIAEQVGPGWESALDTLVAV